VKSKVQADRGSGTGDQGSRAAHADSIKLGSPSETARHGHVLPGDF
jgi:hypothetical protein